jgi:hypothetical protein
MRARSLDMGDRPRRRELLGWGLLPLSISALRDVSSQRVFAFTKKKFTGKRRGRGRKDFEPFVGLEYF